MCLEESSPVIHFKSGRNYPRTQHASGYLRTCIGMQKQSKCLFATELKVMVGKLFFGGLVVCLCNCQIKIHHNFFWHIYNIPEPNQNPSILIFAMGIWDLHVTAKFDYHQYLWAIWYSIETFDQLGGFQSTEQPLTGVGTNNRAICANSVHYYTYMYVLIVLLNNVIEIQAFMGSWRCDVKHAWQA